MNFPKKEQTTLNILLIFPDKTDVKLEKTVVEKFKNVYKNSQVYKTYESSYPIIRLVIMNLTHMEILLHIMEPDLVTEELIQLSISELRFSGPNLLCPEIFCSKSKSDSVVVCGNNVYKIGGNSYWESSFIFSYMIPIFIFYYVLGIVSRKGFYYRHSIIMITTYMYNQKYSSKNYWYNPKSKYIYGRQDFIKSWRGFSYTFASKLIVFLNILCNLYLIFGIMLVSLIMLDFYNWIINVILIVLVRYILCLVGFLCSPYKIPILENKFDSCIMKFLLNISISMFISVVGFFYHFHPMSWISLYKFLIK